MEPNLTARAHTLHSQGDEGLGMCRPLLQKGRARLMPQHVLPLNPSAHERGRMRPSAPSLQHAGPDYCWVSKKTLKRKEESCEEGHFSGSFIFFFFFLPREGS